MNQFSFTIINYLHLILPSPSLDLVFLMSIWSFLLLVRGIWKNWKKRFFFRNCFLLFYILPISPIIPIFPPPNLFFKTISSQLPPFSSSILSRFLFHLLFYFIFYSIVCYSNQERKSEPLHLLFLLPAVFCWQGLLCKKHRNILDFKGFFHPIFFSFSPFQW